MQVQESCLPKRLTAVQVWMNVIMHLCCHDGAAQSLRRSRCTGRTPGCVMLPVQALVLRLALVAAQMMGVSTQETL